MSKGVFGGTPEAILFILGTRGALVGNGAQQAAQLEDGPGLCDPPIGREAILGPGIRLLTDLAAGPLGATAATSLPGIAVRPQGMDGA